MPPDGPSRAGARRRAAALLVSLLASAAAVSACSDGGEARDGDPQPTSPSVSMDALPSSPLTGLPLPGKPPGHPVIAVKIDNSSSSAPQLGLGGADMVAEELVEGGITRLAVFYWSKVPRTVGPVRSMRASDIGIVQPLRAVLVASGGAPPTVRRVADADIRTFTEGAPGYFRDSGRSAPYNLFMRLPELAGRLDAGRIPPPYLPFSADGSLPRGKPARGLTASFSGSSSTSFVYERGGYRNTDTYAAAGDQFLPRTVLVLRVQVGDAGYLDPAGNPVPETTFTGEGAALVFHGGRVVRGRWSKAGYDAPVRLSSAGRPVTLPAGRVWIELVPAAGGSVSVTR